MNHPPFQSAGPKRPAWTIILARVAEITIFICVALFLYISLRGVHPESSVIQEYILAHGGRDTGALNLVTSIYLGFRAYDTLGETIVLLLAVSGTLLFLEKGR